MKGYSHTKEEYDLLFYYAPISYLILDKDCFIINVNKAGALHLGLQKSKLIGTHFSTFLDSEVYQSQFYNFRTEIIETGKSGQLEAVIRRGDGSTFFALVDSAVIKDNQGNFKYFFLTLGDITEQKKQEQKIALALLKEKELNEMKSQFITIASHEFRTPLATILSSAELISKYSHEAEKDKREKHLRKVTTSVQRLNEILMDFMSVKEIENEIIKNNPLPFNLHAFIKDVINEVKSFNGTHNLIYKHHGNCTEAYLDTKLLKICLTNLIINSYKYAPDGGNVEITTEHYLPNTLKIIVRDYGIGIPIEDQNNIFEQFFRAKNAENIQGTGLGLSITKRLVNLMNGTIYFESEQNKGTTFTLTF